MLLDSQIRVAQPADSIDCIALRIALQILFPLLHIDLRRSFYTAIPISLCLLATSSIHIFSSQLHHDALTIIYI